MNVLEATVRLAGMEADAEKDLIEVDHLLPRLRQ